MSYLCFMLLFSHTVFLHENIVQSSRPPVYTNSISTPFLFFLCQDLFKHKVIPDHELFTFFDECSKQHESIIDLLIERNEISRVLFILDFMLNERYSDDKGIQHLIYVLKKDSHNFFFFCKNKMLVETKGMTIMLNLGKTLLSLIQIPLSRQIFSGATSIEDYHCCIVATFSVPTNKRGNLLFMEWRSIVLPIRQKELFYAFLRRISQ